MTLFDISKPTLVFVTQTHHPVLEHLTGYIFALYEFHYHKPVELFFSHIYEAQVFAQYRGAALVMDSDKRPGTVTAVDYILSRDTEETLPEGPEDVPDGRAFNTGRGNSRPHKGARLPVGPGLEAQPFSLFSNTKKHTGINDEHNLADADDLDWFGDEE